MGLMRLFVKDDDEQKKETGSGSSKIVMPQGNNSNANSATSGMTFTPQANIGTYNSDVMQKVVKMYEDGFAKLNKPGYDFFEFYAAIDGEESNGAAYPMAFKMAKALDKSITISHIIKTKDDYVKQITEVHAEYIKQGQAKLNTINSNKNNEQQNLNTDIQQSQQQLENLKQQMALLEQKIQSAHNKLTQIDEKYDTQINEVNNLLQANDVAKQTLLQEFELIGSTLQANVKE